eukprot:8851616-Ditylum_brightwellii.AAC.1
MELVFCFYLTRDDVNGELHVFISRQWHFQIKFFISAHMYCAFGVEIVLLMTIFAVVVSAVGVLTLYG